MARQSSEKNEDDQKEKEPVSFYRDRIAKEIQKRSKFINLRESDTLLFFNPDSGQYHEGDTYLNEQIREATRAYYSKAAYAEITAMIKVDTYIQSRDFMCPVEWINLHNGACDLLTGEFIQRIPKPDGKKYQVEIKKLRKKQKELQEKADPRTADDADHLYYADSKIDREITEIREKYRDEIQKWKQDQLETFGRFNFTSTLPHVYDPRAACPAIDRFFHEVQEGNDNVKRLYELFGYCLWKGYPIKKMFLLVGGFNTAKSRVTALLSAFLGYGNFSALSMQAIQDDKFEKFKLHDKYANISGELAPKFIKDTSLLKELMGGDWIDPRLMHSQKSRLFINFAKLIFLANQIPATYEADDAYYQKVEIMEFLHQFIEGEKGTKNPEDLMAELTTESELSGLFNVSVQALRELLKRQKFMASRSVEKNKELYRAKANPFRFFIEETIGYNNGISAEEDPDKNLFRCYKQDIYANSLAFCRQYRVPEWSETTFFLMLNDYLLKQGIKAKRDSKKGWYYPSIYLNKLWTEQDSDGTMGLDDI